MSVEIITPPTNQDESYQFGIDVLTGLLLPNKRISSKYLYDKIGCDLYNQITTLDEYYLTRTETEILKSNQDKILSLFGKQEFNLIELGPGDGSKTHIFLKGLQEKNLAFNYIPIDISKDYIDHLSQNFKKTYPDLAINGIIADYFRGLHWLHSESTLPNVVLFLGSSIGNFSFPEARVFLHSVWNALKPNDILLIGFDLRKDINILMDAYDDKQGVTRALNLNLLNRINRELGGNFNLKKYRHFASYNVSNGAMES